MEWVRYRDDRRKGLQPTNDLNWGIASSSSATSRPHIDTGGLATGSFILSGKKLWAVARDISDGFRDGCEASRYRQTFSNHDSTQIPDGRRFEAVVLREGDALYVLHRLIQALTQADSLIASCALLHSITLRPSNLLWYMADICTPLAR